jgi:hypothetical protein
MKRKTKLEKAKAKRKKNKIIAGGLAVLGVLAKAARMIATRGR